MRVEFLQCDVCEKKHDVEYVLPPEWITTIQHDNYQLEEEHHFCSTMCLARWATRQVGAEYRLSLTEKEVKP